MRVQITYFNDISLSIRDYKIREHHHHNCQHIWALDYCDLIDGYNQHSIHIKYLTLFHNHSHKTLVILSVCSCTCHCPSSLWHKIHKATFNSDLKTWIEKFTLRASTLVGKMIKIFIPFLKFWWEKKTVVQTLDFICTAIVINKIVMLWSMCNLKETRKNIINNNNKTRSNVLILIVKSTTSIFTIITILHFTLHLWNIFSTVWFPF